MTFSASLSTRAEVAVIKANGDLDAISAAMFREKIDAAAESAPAQLVLDVRRLRYISSAGLRQLVYARQKMPDDVSITLVGASDDVAKTIRLVGLDQSMIFTDQIPE
jgi:anti-anti-sigma factor